MTNQIVYTPIKQVVMSMNDIIDLWVLLQRTTIFCGVLKQNKKRRCRKPKSKPKRHSKKKTVRILSKKK
jgi:hypothetical protein